MRRAAAVLVLALAATGCASQDGGDAGDGSAACGDAVILAASSMSAPLGHIAKQSDGATTCPREITVSTGSSTALAAQIIEGAPADVFVSAASEPVRDLVDRGLVKGDPVVLGVNTASIMVNRDFARRDDIDGVGALMRVDATVGVCVPTAPCGAAADAVLGAAGTTRRQVADTEAATAADLVAKIVSGEIDAGIVFTSDCRVAGNMRATSCVTVPAGQNVRMPVVAARLTDSPAAQAVMARLATTSFVSLLHDIYGLDTPS
ncbi:MAG: molybdate-binding protein [Actinomycetota bacterium]